MDLGLKGKNVLITGGSRGIGAGMAEVFAREGANVCVNYVASSERAVALAVRLKELYGVRAFAIQADLCDEAATIELMDTAVSLLGGIDILVNNASVLADAKGPIEDFAPDKFRICEAGSVEYVLILCREFVRHCKGQGKAGQIVNVLTKSIFWTGSRDNIAYQATKGALASITRGLAHDLAFDGFRVNAVIPGYVRNDRLVPGSDHYERAIKKLPMGRFAEPMEIGECVAFLCSDKGILCNGTLLDCTGGTLVGD